MELNTADFCADYFKATSCKMMLLCVFNECCIRLTDMVEKIIVMMKDQHGFASFCNPHISQSARKKIFIMSLVVIEIIIEMV